MMITVRPELSLSPIQQNDGPAIVRILNAPDVAAGLTDVPSSFTEADWPGELNFVQKSEAYAGRPAHFAIRQSEETIGGLSFSVCNPRVPSTQVKRFRTEHRSYRRQR